MRLFPYGSPSRWGCTIAFGRTDGFSGSRTALWTRSVRYCYNCIEWKVVECSGLDSDSWMINVGVVFDSHFCCKVTDDTFHISQIHPMISATSSILRGSPNKKYVCWTLLFKTISEGACLDDMRILPPSRVLPTSSPSAAKSRGKKLLLHR